jgi:preprotein translocase subunit YajC
LSTFSFQAPPPAPGRDGPAGSGPTTTTPGTTAPTDVPGAAPGGIGAPGSPLGSVMPLLIVVLPILLLFMTMRGQTKKQKQVESGLKTGDTVITNSGLIGKITDMTETRVKVEIAPGVSVRMLKSAISGVDGGEPKPDATKPDAATKDKPQEKKA